MALRVTQIVAGGSHSLALLEDGTVEGWGYNRHGQRTIPNFGGRRVIQIRAGTDHSLALLENGTVIGWGGK